MVLEELKTETRTIVLYEAPHRLMRTLQELYDILGERRITVCRELTKKHETAFQTTLKGAVDWYSVNEPRGECVLVIEGKSRESIEKEKQESWQEISVEEHMERYESQGISRKEAMKLVAVDRGTTKREIYQYLLEHKQ